MPFKIAVSQPASAYSKPQTKELWSELLASKLFRKIAGSAVICLVIATAGALSDRKNSVFANLGLGPGAFSEPAADLRPQLGSSATPDRGGNASSWSLDYLVQANSSFIQAAKQKVIQYVIRRPKVEPAPAPESNLANSLAWDAAGQGGGQQRQAQPHGRMGGGLQAFQNPVAIGGAAKGSQPAFSPLPPVPQPRASIPIVAVPVVPAQHSNAAPVASYSQARPAARAVVGSRYQGTTTSFGQPKSHVEVNYGYAPAQ